MLLNHVQWYHKCNDKKLCVWLGSSQQPGSYTPKARPRQKKRRVTTHLPVSATFQQRVTTSDAFAPWVDHKRRLDLATPWQMIHQYNATNNDICHDRHLTLYRPTRLLDRTRSYEETWDEKIQWPKANVVRETSDLR